MNAKLVENLVNSVKLYAPAAYWALTPSQKSAYCNGCGTKGLGGIITPDTLYGLSITPACDIHDDMYRTGQTIEDKESADRAFSNNMIRIIKAHRKQNPPSWGLGLSTRMLDTARYRRARKYYLAVKHFGGPAFWAGKNKPQEMQAQPIRFDLLAAL